MSTELCAYVSPHCRRLFRVHASVGVSSPKNDWAGLHNNVLDRPSAKVAPVGCQLMTMAFKIKIIIIIIDTFSKAQFPQNKV